MNILVLTPVAPCGNAPPQGGAQMRVSELLRPLARRHSILVLALAQPGDIPGEDPGKALDPPLTVEFVPHSPGRLGSIGRSIWAGTSLYYQLHRSKDYAVAVDRLLDSDAFDLIQCEFPYMAQYCMGRGTPWILVEHNVEFRLSEAIAQTRVGPAAIPYQLYARREAAHRKREEIDACRHASAVVAMSEVDREILLGEMPGLQVSVVPNGVNLDYYQAETLDDSPATPEGPSAVFIGRMDYRPNVDGAIWFCREVLPLIRNQIPSFRFWIVGAAPKPSVLSLQKEPGVEVIGPVPDTRPFLSRATVTVVPLRAGSGTRLKILEAFAAGRPVVSTRIGCEGIDAVSGTHLLVADTAEEFARSIVGLVEDPSRAERLGKEARGLVDLRHGWEASADLMDELYYRVLASRRPEG